MSQGRFAGHSTCADGSRHPGCTRLQSRAFRRAMPLCVAGLIVACLTGCQAIRREQARQRVNHGQKLLDAQDLEAALAEFQAAAELAPQMAVAHSKMGVIYRRMGRYEQAITCFVEAIRRNPLSFDDTLNLAQLYHFSKRIADAIQAYLHAVELRPDDFDAQLNLGVCYQQAGDLNQAIERFQEAIDIDPDRPFAYVNLGVGLDAQGKHYDAIRAFKEALERDSHQPLVLVNLAHTYINQDRLKMARHALEQAIRMDPNLAGAHETLGYCLFKSRDFGVAEQAYSTALRCDWRLPRAHAGLGSLKMLQFVEDDSRSDLRDAALEHWHRSLELDSEQPRIRKLIARYRPEHVDPETALLSQQAKR